MTDAPRKPLGPKIVATVLLVLPILYVGSFGPACWLSYHSGGIPYWSITMKIFRPVMWIAGDSGRANEIFSWYMEIGVPGGHNGYIRHDIIGYR